VVQQAWAIVSTENDATAFYRDGLFTSTLRSLLLSLIRSYYAKQVK
jgi:hypothetical protein